MKYFKRNGEDHLENGPALLRVGEIARKPSPFFKDRTIRIFDVLEVKRKGKSPIERGNRLGISFPNDKLTDSKYEWGTKGVFEECAMPLVCDVKVPERTTELVHVGAKSPHE